jgi:hypothetical protein
MKLPKIPKIIPGVSRTTKLSEWPYKYGLSSPNDRNNPIKKDSEESDPISYEQGSEMFQIHY